MRGLPELLAPAGNLEKLKIALLYGADAVYCAGKSFGMRAGAGNLSREELEEGVSFAQQRGKRVYITINIIPHNQEMEGLAPYLKFLGDLKVDGLIVSDPGVISLAQEIVPRIPLHLSTQANTVNWRSVRFWQQQGIRRVVLAREMSLGEIEEVCRLAGGELEVFVHGAMCMAYSGRCLLSMYLTGRDANRGDCAQPCRWKYQLVEEKRPGEYMPVVEDGGGTYIFNSKDLCLIEYIPELVRAGVASLKIEGRMKGIYYVATVTKAYRQALDAYGKDPESFQFVKDWRDELEKVSHRDYTTGFFLGPPGEESHGYNSSRYVRNCDFIGLVKDYQPGIQIALVEQRNPFALGDKVEAFGPETPPFSFVVEDLYDEGGQEISVAGHPQQLVRLKVPRPLEANAMLRRPKEKL